MPRFIFPEKQQTICMKFQALFSVKNKKMYFKMSSAAAWNMQKLYSGNYFSYFSTTINIVGTVEKLDKCHYSFFIEKQFIWL